AARIDELNPCGAAVFVHDAPDPVLSAQLEILAPGEHRHQRVGRLRLRTDHATVALAMTTVHTSGARDAVRILVWFAQVRGGCGIGMIAQPAYRSFKHATCVGALERRRGILLLTRSFEDVAAIDLLAP